MEALTKRFSLRKGAQLAVDTPLVDSFTRSVLVCPQRARGLTRAFRCHPSSTHVKRRWKANLFQSRDLRKRSCSASRDKRKCIGNGDLGGGGATFLLMKTTRCAKGSGTKQSAQSIVRESIRGWVRQDVSPNQSPPTVRRCTSTGLRTKLNAEE